MDYSSCTENTTDSKIVVKEHKSSFCIENISKVQVEKIQVDGCLIDADQEKCDWLFVLPKANTVLFVELKGSNITKAGSQIESTIRATNERFCDYKKECYVASTKVPKFGSQVQKLKIDFKKKHNAGFHVKNGRFTLST